MPLASGLPVSEPEIDPQIALYVYIFGQCLDELNSTWDWPGVTFDHCVIVASQVVKCVASHRAIYDQMPAVIYCGFRLHPDGETTHQFHSYNENKVPTEDDGIAQLVEAGCRPQVLAFEISNWLDIFSGYLMRMPYGIDDAVDPYA